MNCAAQGLALFESLVALLLFSILVMVSFQSLHYLSQWYSELTMHRLAVNQLENISEFLSRKTLLDEYRLTTWFSTWASENKKMNPQFSSQLHCQSTRCTVTLSWKSKKSNHQDQSQCYFLVDSCVQLQFSIKLPGSVYSNA